MTNYQRELLHKLADELKLNHKSRGNHKSKTLYINKSNLNVPNLRNDERISQQLQVLTNASIPIHQNFFEVVSSVAPTTSSAANNEVQQPTVSRTKKRGRPPKNMNRISTSSQP